MIGNPIVLFQLTNWHPFSMRLSLIIDDKLRHNIVKVVVDPRATG